MCEGKEYTKRNEGYREGVYLDTKGNPTGGWGHRVRPWDVLPAKPTKEYWERVFEADYAIAQGDFEAICKLYGLEGLGAWREYALIDMCFQMGRWRVIGFRKTLYHLGKHEWRQAASEVLFSKYFKEDTPSRALRNAMIFQSGEAPDEIYWEV